MKSACSFNLENLKLFIDEMTPTRKFIVAYSGGLDSHVLLHSMASLKASGADIQIKAVHINHGISSQALLWEKHCQQICDALKIPLIIKKIQIKTTKNLEATLRSFRYQALKEELTPDFCLLTAHNKNDQAETFLLQLFRGAGPRGLAAMPEKIKFAQSYLIRPLLQFTRKELHQYAVSHQLHWIEDESNALEKFDRNFIRHQLLPLIQQRWIGSIDTISRSAQHAAQAANLIAQFSESKFQDIFDPVKKTLSIQKLLTLSTVEQTYVLRLWLEHLRLPLPNEMKIRQIQREVLIARKDAKPLVTWFGVEIRRYRDNLYAMAPLISPPVDWETIWNLKKPLELPAQLGTLYTEKIFQNFSLKNIDQVLVRFRRGGEVFHPRGRIGSHPLKKLFQEWEVPPWMRGCIPLIYINDQLTMVVGYATREN